MYFAGHLKKDGKFWMIEVPDLDIATQGRTQKEALAMIADVIELATDSPGFKVKIISKGKREFVVTANNVSKLIALFMKRQRQSHGLTIRQVASAMNYKAHGAYAQYERGTSSPGIETLEKFVTAINPDAILRLSVDSASLSHAK